MKKILITSLLFASCFIAHAQCTEGLDPLIQNVYSREIQSLNGCWDYFSDPLETGYYNYRMKPSPTGFFQEKQVDNIKEWKEYDFDLSPKMPVPGDWNTQDSDYFNYEGTIWFRRKFKFEPASGARTLLYFGAVNYDAKVYVNGKKAGEHIGGYTPFNFDVTDLLQSGDNSVVVKVDNKRKLDGVPTNNFDWFNYGGITRDILIVNVPQKHIRTYSVNLADGVYDHISVSVTMNDGEAGQKVQLSIPELKIDKTAETDANGVASFDVKASPVLWCPENPKLYDVVLTSASDTVEDRIGFRRIETSGRDILLNGKSIFLKGISIHEEAAFRNGRIFSVEEDRVLLGWAKELGCNYVRLAHYPHNEQMVREAEKMGLLVWSEIPVYWTIQWENPDVYANALNQLDEMIERDHNRANIIIWSIANETPHGEAREKFLSSLATYARQKDNTRLISMAMERNDKSKEILSVRDAMSDYVDVIAFNEYVGWYDGKAEKLDRVRWEIDYDKPIIISEFGAGAQYGNHGPEEDFWTEEYQADVYVRTLKMIDERMPKVSGISPWILKDFRSSKRMLPQVQDGFNRKGVISDKGQKKLAFYVLQEWFAKKDAENAAAQSKTDKKKKR